MVGSRTVKALTALLISMTVGALALMVLETAPATPRAQQLVALAAPADGVGAVIHQTSVPLQPIKWRNLIVHSSGAEDAGIVDGCHFLVEADGSVWPTELWKRQISGHHVYVPGRDFNADSIGVCLMGQYTLSDPRIQKKQFDSLVDLTRSLQQAFRMPADRVYLRSDLDPNSLSPGDGFPAGDFNSRLLRSVR